MVPPPPWQTKKDTDIIESISRSSPDCQQASVTLISAMEIGSMISSTRVRWILMLSIPLSVTVIEEDDDRAFMEHIFNDYQRLMYQTIFRIVNDPWLTEDLIQTTIEKLIASLDRFRHLNKAALTGYIASASRNTAISYLRKTQRKHQLLIDDWSEAEDKAAPDTPESLLLKKEELRAFASVWKKLDERSRSVLYGRYILKRSYAEIGSMLGVRPDSARMAVTRAKRTALSLLKKEI